MKRPLYHAELRKLDNWEPYLLEHSGLPGPRANIELAQAVAEEATEDRLRAYASISAQEAPTNTALEFLAFCGVIGLGRLYANGDADTLDELRGFASDPRWRIREAVCLGLQRLGDRDMDRLIHDISPWIRGSSFEQRAVVETLCEPRLLRTERHARAVIAILDEITSTMTTAQRPSDGFLALKKTLGYAWSVAIVALPSDGKAAFERWCENEDSDVVWVVEQNLNKARLLRMDGQWVVDVKIKYKR